MSLDTKLYILQHQILDLATTSAGTGVTGWFDDDTNFRITVVSGVITNIGPTISGGFVVV